MSNGGFEQPTGLGIPGTDIGAGVCPVGYQCIGPTVAGVCLGTCAPRPGGPGAPIPILPPQDPIYGPGIGPPVGTRPGDRIDPATGQIVARRRRMNYSNQKALRRALRRATGYARQQKAVRKAAQEFAREFGPKRRTARRDLPRGHVHVR